MSTQHTPGPWELRRSVREYWFIDHEQGGEGYTLTKLDCNEADAHLIAAAPDLLAALQNCVNVLSLALPLFDDESTDDKDSREEVGSVLDAARDALAKATGGAVMTAAQRWEVLTLVGDDWDNAWSLDGEPETFDSYGDADAALAEHLRDCQWAVNAGHLDDMPARDAFRIATI